MAILPIDASELASAREDFLSIMTSTCNVTRYVFANDAEGGQAKSPSNLGPFQCRLVTEPPTGSFADEVVEADRVVEHANWLLLVPVGTDIKPTDRVTVTGVTDVFEVVGTNRDGTDRFMNAWLLRRVR